MAIGVEPEHRELAAVLRDWGRGLVASGRAAEGDPEARFDDAWAAVVRQGAALVALPEDSGGGGGRVLDAAVALEACAEALVPGPLLGAALAAVLVGGCKQVAEGLGSGARCAVALDPALQVGGRLTGVLPVVLDAPGADWVVVGGRTGEGAERWFAVRGEQVRVHGAAGLDLTRRTGDVTVDVPVGDVVALPDLDASAVRRAALTLAAAEASGIARWCLDTAVEHAKVRTQFGQPIGRFQAVKQLCATMLETAEAVTAVAWDAASAADGDPDQWDYAAAVAGALALDGAVRVAQDCIQVLGGIGFTFEHDAHLRLRRAVAMRSLLGSGAQASRLARLAAGGARRRVVVDLAGRDGELRPAIAALADGVAALPEDEQGRALVDHGLVAPHWPAPYGRGAGPVEQLVIDEELARAGVPRPDLKIGAWALPTLLAHGTDQQRERFVRPTLLGELVWCQLFSEPEAGSDLASLRTRAERTEGGWRLTGQKVWTSLAREADWGICLARTDPDAPQHRGITYFLVDMRSAGLDIRPLREMTGDALFNEVFLDDVFVPDDCVVGEVGGGWRLARTTLANERVAMAGTKLGTSTERALALLGDGADEAARVRVGRAVALATACTLLDVRTTLRSLGGQGPGPESSVAKLLSVRSRQDASELVVDLLGPRAWLDEADVRADVHEMLLTRCLSIAGGTTQILRNVAAERVLGLPR